MERQWEYEEEGGVKKRVKVIETETDGVRERQREPSVFSVCARQ